MKQIQIDPRLHNLLFALCLFGVAGTVGFVFACMWTGRAVGNETYLILLMFAGGLGLKFEPRGTRDESQPGRRLEDEVREEAKEECEEETEGEHEGEHDAT